MFRKIIEFIFEIKEILLMLTGALISGYIGYLFIKYYEFQKNKSDFKSFIQILIDELKNNENNLNNIYSISFESYKNISNNPIYNDQCPKDIKENVDQVYANLRQMKGRAQKMSISLEVENYKRDHPEDINEVIKKLKNIIK